MKNAVAIEMIKEDILELKAMLAEMKKTGKSQMGFTVASLEAHIRETEMLIK